MIPRLMSKGASLTLDTGCALVLANCTITILVVVAGAPSRPRYTLALRRVSSNPPFHSLSSPSPRTPVLCTLADALKARQTEYYTNTRPLLPTIVFRNYQTSLPSSYPLSLSSLLAPTLTIFREKTSCFASVPHLS